MWAGVDNVWEQKKTEAKKMPACTVLQAQVKIAQTPTRQVHAVLGGIGKGYTANPVTDASWSSLW